MQGSPTDWSYLYTAFKSAQNLNATVSSAEKTIVSLDLQHYSKCIQLQSNLEISEQFIFRMGELQIVFAALKTLGKIIDGSGLDQSFIEARNYGPNTVEQIKNGKHIKRSFEGFLTLYVSLYKIYLNELIDQNLLIEKELRQGVIIAITSLNDYRNAEKVELIKTHESLVAILQSLNFQEIQNNFHTSLNHEAQFLRIFMRMFEYLLLFIRATRQKMWELHLASLHELVKYFFAFDMQNYARLTPVYLAEMFSLKETDSYIWNYFDKGYFCVNKNTAPHSVIGADHAIEHENRAMKVLGGIKGIANNRLALEQYFFIMPEMNSIVDEFCETFNITNEGKTKIFFFITINH